MPKTHRKVIDAIIASRPEACGIAFYNCQGCAEPNSSSFTSGNRHCPTCQDYKAQQWLQTQIGRQLPGHHFLITFTVPEQLRSFMRQNQRACYSALFKASSEAIKKLALDQKHIGWDLPGFFGVLHTWGRTLQYHPHIHYVVSGGAIRSADRLASFQNRFLSPRQSSLCDLPSQVPRSDEASPSVRSNSTGCLADRLERQLPTGWLQPSYSQISCPLRLQSRHLQLAHRCRPGPHGPDSLPQTAQ